MKPFLTATLVLLAVGGCDSSTSPSSFTNTVLTLESASLPPEAGITELTPSTITFQPDGTLAVESCNACGGSYDWDGNLLHVSGLGCTEIACGPNLDLGEWLWGERVVVSDESDTSDGEVTLVAERDGLIATFVFSFRDLE